MSRTSPFRIVLSKQEREALERRARKYTLPYFEVLRAKMIQFRRLVQKNPSEIKRRATFGRLA